VADEVYAAGFLNHDLPHKRLDIEPVAILLFVQVKAWALVG
jgi:hypothetical protein